MARQEEREVGEAREAQVIVQVGKLRVSSRKLAGEAGGDHMLRGNWDP